MNSVATAIQYDVIRERSLGPIRDELVGVFNQTRSRKVNADRFEWLYHQNPDGHAVIWSLRRSDTGEMVGFTACIPRRMIVNGEERLAWIGSDFSVLPKYRTLGLATKLRRAAKSAIDAGEIDFLYAHPNDRMAVIHQRVGHANIGSIQRYAKLLSTGPILQEYSRSRLLADVGKTILDPALRLTDPQVLSRRQYTICEESELRFGEQFSRLFHEVRPERGIIGVRDADYLHWRYGQNPLADFRLLTAHKGNRLSGFLIYSVIDDAIVVQDVFPATTALVRDLFSEVTRIGRQRQLQSATFTVLEETPLQQAVCRCGYHRRAERSQMFTYAADDSDWAHEVVEGGEWYITVGDRDV